MLGLPPDDFGSYVANLIRPQLPKCSIEMARKATKQADIAKKENE